MDIDKVYLAKIYVKSAEKIVEPVGKVSFFNMQVEHNAHFVKTSLIYNASNEFKNVYIDLESGEKYYKFDVKHADVGQLFINLKEGLIPVKNLLDINKKNISKRKILKKYNERIKEEGVK